MINKKRFEEIVSRFKSIKILVYGDIILDRYIFGQVERISPEAPVPVLKVANEEYRLGGAGNVAVNIDVLGAKGILSGVLGNDGYGNEIYRIKSVDNIAVISAQNNSLVKTRVIAQRQQIVRIDREKKISFDPLIEANVINSIQDQEFDGIIVSDYAKGSITNQMMGRLKEIANKRDIPIFVDPKPPNFNLYSGIDGITPNLGEAQAIVNRQINNDDDAAESVKDILKRFNTKYALITRGDKGITASERGVGTFHFPAYSHEVFDVTGAGDTVISVLLLSLVSGATLKEAVSIANIAASIVIEKIGTSQATVEEIRARLKMKI